ncbi:aldehyde dehydrogenase (NADP(+)) [Rhodococcus sp. NPDC127530]|uniref:aldehyde dehydrogenase (NADP(+)) n=1 Tax=unclassified Rhodococcus (in: high G+C Gram-positive bacteria) TaxID=192944 RepID=UPI003636668C
MTAIAGTDPRTGTTTNVIDETTTAEVTRIARAAADAAPQFEQAGRGFRAALLRAIADELAARRHLIVETADRETAIGPTRLNGELTRTVYQARLFADVLDEGSYLEAAIDHAADTPMGPGPDLRRLLVPIGPVAVFGASNFPLAFSVPGGDTVSALAAGNPVVVKAHSSHPATSLAAFEAMVAAARRLGTPDGVLSIVFGQAAGGALVADPHIKAVGFTGSLGGGQALLDIIGRRDEPIPFYGELSSLNPVVVTPGAAAARGPAIGTGLADSFTVSAGQLCTKPGLVFVPAGDAGDALAAAAAEAVGDTDAPVLLNERIFTSFGEISGRAEGLGAVSVLARGGKPAEEGFAVTPLLLSITAADLTPQATGECFGPMTIIARYSSDDELRAAIAELPSSLTGTIHAEDDEVDRVSELTGILRAKAGRVLYNGYPTGVLVSWAQTHGGPWPATNTLHTSVGTTAIRRFLRPVTWQNAPEFALPEELRESYAAIPRRVDGRLIVPNRS